MPHPEQPEAMVEDMKAAGLDPAFIYAFEKTGLLVTEQNQHLIPEQDLAGWDASIEGSDAKRRQTQEGWRERRIPRRLSLVRPLPSPDFSRRCSSPATACAAACRC
jgi:hypothetical protein